MVTNTIYCVLYAAKGDLAYIWRQNFDIFFQCLHLRGMQPVLEDTLPVDKALQEEFLRLVGRGKGGKEAA